VWGEKVLPIKKTKHLTTMDGKTHRWLLFVTGNGIAWAQDGFLDGGAASAGGDVASSTKDLDFKLKHAVDIGWPCGGTTVFGRPWGDLLGGLHHRTEVINRVVDAENFPAENPSRHQVSKDCKQRWCFIQMPPTLWIWRPNLLQLMFHLTNLPPQTV